MLNILRKRHYVVVEETEVTKVLELINKHCAYSAAKTKLMVGNCGWLCEPTKWFVHFDSTDKEWVRILKELPDSVTVERKRRSKKNNKRNESK